MGLKGLTRRHRPERRMGPHQDCVERDELGELESTLLAQREEIAGLWARQAELESALAEHQEIVAQMRLAAEAFVGACARAGVR